MTSATTNETTIRQEAWDSLIVSFAAKARTAAIDSRSTPSGNQNKEKPAIHWLADTAKALSRLPWQETNLPDGRIAPQPEAAASLLWLLLNALDVRSRPPTAIIPTSRGGVAAEWHMAGFDLEIECDPEGNAEYSVAGPGIEEFEGPIGPDVTLLKAHLGMLPKISQ